MACCGRGKSRTTIITPKAIGPQIAPKQLLRPKPILKTMPKPLPLSVPVISNKSLKGPHQCPLCGSKLMAVTRVAGGRKKSYMQCVNSKCDYRSANAV